MTRMTVANIASGCSPPADCPGARRSVKLPNNFSCPRLFQRLFDCLVALFDAVFIERLTQLGAMQSLLIDPGHIIYRPLRLLVEVADLIAAQRRPDHDGSVEQHLVELLIRR